MGTQTSMPSMDPPGSFNHHAQCDGIHYRSRDMCPLCQYQGSNADPCNTQRYGAPAACIPNPNR
eukprot:15356058-Ditylum_brightwellii.AAC.1